MGKSMSGTEKRRRAYKPPTLETSAVGAIELFTGSVPIGSPPPAPSGGGK